MENGKIATIPISRSKLFYRWLELTKPFHKLPKQELTALAWILYYFDKYKLETNNEDTAWKLTFSYPTKLEIKQHLGGIKDQSFQNILTRLRKKNVIKDNKVMRNYIPTLDPKSKEFKLIFNFKIVDEK